MKRKRLSEEQIIAGKKMVTPAQRREAVAHLYRGIRRASVGRAGLQGSSARWRDELLNETLFRTLGEARLQIEARGHHYNHHVPALEARQADGGRLRSALAPQRRA